MKETNCDEILMAMMAVADGEEAGIDLEDIRVHSATCESCRREVEKAGAITEMLKNYTRGREKSDLWPVIATRIGTVERGTVWSNGHMFAALVLVLAAYKLIEMLPATHPGHFLKMAPILAAAVLFMFLRENPFKINTELIPER